MAEFQKVMSELKRFCDKHHCVNCPIAEGVMGDRDSFCSAWVTNHPEKAEPIIMQWAAKNPIKTNGMKFREVFGEDMMAMLIGELTGEHAPLDEWLDAEYKGGQDG